MLVKAARKLHRRREWHGLQISVENQTGSFRHWRNSHDGSSGKTRMLYDYGYVRRSEGTDGDHLDVFVGPEYNAPFVYVVTTMRSPDFLEIDEQKCMLGFTSQQAAREAFSTHYDDPRFLGHIHAVALTDFLAFVADPKNRGQLIKGLYVTKAPKVGTPELPPFEQIYGPYVSAEDRESMLARRKKRAKARGMHGTQAPKLARKRVRLGDWPTLARPTTR